MNDFFFEWVEAIAQSMAWDDRIAFEQADGLVKAGASRRQERLEAQQNILANIGLSHRYEKPDNESDSIFHSHDEPYEDQSETIHKFPDNWSIKRLKTYGDLRYEGEMMSHCISEDARGYCGDCRENGGGCSNCDGNGSTECYSCEGSGTEACPNCEGGGREEGDCPECDGGYSAEQKCTRCVGKGKKPDGSSCESCAGTGNRSIHYKGEVECDNCGGWGKDVDQEDCYKCDGQGHHDCGNCSGYGKTEQDCEECEGRGLRECSDCDGSGSGACGQCDGEGNCSHNGGWDVSGGPKDYYKPYTQEEADGFARAPGGPYSLRDPDNIPHVSFLHDKDGDRSAKIDNVYGREDKAPKPEYQHRILQYLHNKIDPNPSQERLFPDGCGDCGGAGNETYTERVLHEECKGAGCSECAWGGRINRKVTYPCSACEGTGKPLASVQWGGGRSQKYTSDEISNILSGKNEKPNAMFIAKHKENANQAESLNDVGHASDWGNTPDWNSQMVEAPCDTCRGFPGNSRQCYRCGGSGNMQRRQKNNETHDLYAIPSISIPKDSMIYSPLDQGWSLKSGKGAKIPLETAGTKISWDKLGESADDLPDYAQDLLRTAFVKTAASKRQELLERQRTVLQGIGDQHEQDADPADCDREDGVDHRHSGVYDEQASPYQEQSESVFKFPDDWHIKKMKTFGDLKYEGKMMNHCIEQDADPQEDEACGGSGACQSCSGGGTTNCGSCWGSGSEYCPTCNGQGRTETNDPPLKHTLEDHPPVQSLTDHIKQDHLFQEGGAYPIQGTLHDQLHKHPENYPQSSWKDCEDCGGVGETECEGCEGTGAASCDDCAGSGSCPNCDGRGQTGGGGPTEYYRPFSQDEADNFQRSPGGPYSLRDSDNVPHVSFLNVGRDGIDNVFGKEDKTPKPEYQHRILKYMHSKTDPEDSISVGWGGNYSSTYSHQDIKDILEGNNPKPDVLLMAHHKKNANQAEVLMNGNAAHYWGQDTDRHSPPTEGPCSYCSGTKVYGDLACFGCGGAGTVKRFNHNSETHDLYAIPSVAVNKDSLIFSPAEKLWKIKSGRASKIPFETAGTKIPWGVLNRNDEEYNPQERKHLPEDIQQALGSVNRSIVYWKGRDGKYA